MSRKEPIQAREMFIDTMTSTELLREYQADIEEIRQKTDSFDKSEYLNGYLRKHRKSQRVVITRHTKTSRNNKYLGVYIYCQVGKGKALHWTWASYHAAIMNTSRGQMIVTFYEENEQAVKYTPHFFQRYKERLMRVADWKLRNALNAADTQEKIATLYIQRNLGTAWIETKSVYKNKLHVFAPVPDGVTLLQWDDKYKTMQANTFITYDMLDQKQLDMVTSLKEYGKLSEEERKNVSDPTFRVN